MLRGLGAVLLLLGGGLLGYRMSCTLRERRDTLTSLKNALNMLGAELEFRGAPLLELLALLEKRTDPPAQALFSQCVGMLKQGEEQDFSAVWQKSLEDTCPALGTEERQVLVRLGRVLGRYGVEQQGEELRQTCRILSEYESKAAEEFQRMGRIYQTLGLCAGAFGVVLLI